MITSQGGGSARVNDYIKHVVANIMHIVANITHGVANIARSAGDILHGAGDILRSAAKICLPKTHFFPFLKIFLSILDFF